MRSLTCAIGRTILWLGALALGLVSAVSLRAEILAREGLAGWEATLEEPRGDLAALRRAIRLEPWRADLRAAAGIHRSAPAGEREQRLVEAIQRAPSHALAYLALGSLEAAQGRTSAARQLYRAGDRMDPAGSATQIRLGALWIGLMDLDEALPHLRRAALLSPAVRLPEALSLALIVTTDDQILASLVPEGALNHLSAARYLEQRGISGAAERLYESASASDPASAAIHESHLRFHLLREERAAAVRLIRKRLPHVPEDLLLRLQLTQLLSDLKRAGEARRELETCERRHPGSETVANQRAILELELGDLELAHRLAGSLVARRPGMASARITLARTLWKRGDRRGAAIELSRAEALEPARPDVVFLLARLSRETGDDTAAARYYMKAIERGYIHPSREELSALPAAARAAHGG